MSFAAKFVTIISLIVLATGAGYLARRTGLLPERAATWVMTFVVIGGYPPVAFLSIWAAKLRASDAALPAMGAVHVAAMMLVGLAVARGLEKTKPERGLFAIASSVANNGSTLGGFVLFLLFGEMGLALSSIYCLMFMPVIVLLVYPVARHHSPEAPRMPLAKLYLRSIFDLRSIGMVTTACGIVLSAMGVARPAFVAEYHVVDVLIFLLVAAAYFGIGLRLHVSQFGASKRHIVALACVRFGCGLAVGSALLALTRLTPWPLTGLRGSVFLVQAFVPTAVMTVAAANMFGLNPRRASVLFVSNTVLYLVVVLPCVLWRFGG